MLDIHINELRDLISDNKFEKAFDLLKKISKNEKSLLNKSILLQSRYSQITRDYNFGTINREDNQVEVNRITSALLNFLVEIENELIANIPKTENGFSKLKQIIYIKTNYERDFVNSLKKFRTSKYKFQIEAIKKLIKYDYRISYRDTGIILPIKFGQDEELTLTKVIAYGMHSIISIAEDQRSNQFILKILHPKYYQDEKKVYIERHEIQKRSSGTCSYISDIKSIIDEDELVIIILNKYEQDLRTYVLDKKHTSLSYYDDICKIFNCICEAVKYLHEVEKVAHRDIGPTNILLNKQKNGFLTDFDNIYKKDIEEDLRYKTIEKDDIYFDVYIAPEYLEVLHSKKPQFNFEQAKRYDLYSLCVTLLFCLIKKKLNSFEITEYLDKTPNSEGDKQLYAIALLDHPNFEFDDRVKKFFKKGLNKKEEKRFTSINDLVKEFNKIEPNVLPHKSKIGTSLSNKLAYFFWSLFIVPILFFSIYVFFEKKEIETNFEKHINWNNNKGEKFISKYNRDDVTILLENEILILSNPKNAYVDLFPETNKRNEKTLRHATQVDGATELLCNEATGIGVTFKFSTYHLAGNPDINLKKDLANEVFGDISYNLSSKTLPDNKNSNEDSNDCYDLGKMLGFSNRFREEYQVLMFFSYYYYIEKVKVANDKNIILDCDENNMAVSQDSIGLVFRYPAPPLNSCNIIEYIPENRPWFNYIRNRSKFEGGIILKEKTDTIYGITHAYKDYKKINVGLVRTLFCDLKYDNNSRIIYGIDIALKD